MFHHTKNITLKIRITWTNDTIVQIAVLSLISTMYKELTETGKSCQCPSVKWLSLHCSTIHGQNYRKPLVVCSINKSWKSSFKPPSQIAISTIPWLSSSSTGHSHERFTTSTLTFRVWINKNELRSVRRSKNND